MTQLLADLHLNYETCEEYKLELSTHVAGNLNDTHFRLSTKAMRFSEDKRSIRINEFVRLDGLPPECHQYVVNGRTPLGWFIDRYRTKQDKQSGLINDPNEWFDNPRDIVSAIQRIIYVSVETVKIVNNLPSPFPEDMT